MKRLFVQIIAAALQNPFLANLFRGQIHSGGSKHICTPGLNCYSCPAAAFSCPVGSMQLFLAGARHNISLFVAGTVVATGAIFGRAICGYICPFGLFQDLLYRIKSRKFRTKLRVLRYVKYGILVLFVLILPFAIRHELSRLGQAWFCKYICPSGTIFGAIPLLAANEVLRDSVGGLFWLKSGIGIAIVSAGIFIYRPFCRILCPLGAFYGLFNPVAAFRLRCNREKCNSCRKCEGVCDSGINPLLTPDSPECIRCGDCVKACGKNALSCSFAGKQGEKKPP
jgi:polyferredoxin